MRRRTLKLAMRDIMCHGELISSRRTRRPESRSARLSLRQRRPRESPRRSWAYRGLRSGRPAKTLDRFVGARPGSSRSPRALRAFKQRSEREFRLPCASGRADLGRTPASSSRHSDWSEAAHLAPPGQRTSRWPRNLLADTRPARCRRQLGADIERRSRWRRATSQSNGGVGGRRTLHGQTTPTIPGLARSDRPQS